MPVDFDAHVLAAYAMMDFRLEVCNAATEGPVDASEVTLAEAHSCDSPAPSSRPFLAAASGAPDVPVLTPSTSLDKPRSRVGPDSLPAVARQEYAKSIGPSAALTEAWTTFCGGGGNLVPPVVTVTVERGGKAVTVDIHVADLQAIPPYQFLEVSGAILHTLPYQAARNAGVPLGGVLLAQSGFMFGQALLPSSSIITAIGKRRITGLVRTQLMRSEIARVWSVSLNRVAGPVLQLDLEDALCDLHDGLKTTVRYTLLSDVHTERVAVFEMERCWHKMTVRTVLSLWLHACEQNPMYASLLRVECSSVTCGMTSLGCSCRPRVVHRLLFQQLPPCTAHHSPCALTL